MEEYIEEMKSDTESCSKALPNKNSILLREVLVSLCSISIVPKIKITNPCDENGNVVFEAYTESAKDLYDFFLKHKSESQAYTNFIANFTGELLIRENIDVFAKIIMDLKKSYSNKVTKFKHKTFGMTIFDNKIVFKFHISLLESILTEDIKRMVDA